MLTVVRIAEIFKDCRFQQLTLLPDGTIALLCAGCLHGQIEELLGTNATATCEIDYKTGIEAWIITPKVTDRFPFTSMLVAGWRRFTLDAALQIEEFPCFTITNYQGEGWGSFLQQVTAEQIKAVYNLLTLRRIVKVHSDQSQVRKGYIALEIDGERFLLSPKAFLVRAEWQEQSTLDYPRGDADYLSVANLSSD